MILSFCFLVNLHHVKLHFNLFIHFPKVLDIKTLNDFLFYLTFLLLYCVYSKNIKWQPLQGIVLVARVNNVTCIIIIYVHKQVVEPFLYKYNLSNNKQPYLLLSQANICSFAYDWRQLKRGSYHKETAHFTYHTLHNAVLSASHVHKGI